MEHRKIRQIIHEVCDGFYIQIKDEREWDKVNSLAQEAHRECKEEPFAIDLIRAFVAEWCRVYLPDNVQENVEE